MKELPITLILRPFNFDTLATQTYEFAIEEMLKESSIYSLLIILIGCYSLTYCRKSCRSVFCPFWAEKDVPEGWEGFRKLLEGSTLHSDRT